MLKKIKQKLKQIAKRKNNPHNNIEGENNEQDTYIFIRYTVFI